MPPPEEELVTCSSCGNPVPFHRRTCHVCEQDMGFPNVRRAETEEPQLKKRYDTGVSSAAARGVEKILQEFESSVSCSEAVIARRLGQVLELIHSDNLLYTSFSKQLSQNARIAENNASDQIRESVDSAINPLYSQEIVHSVISITGQGVPYYGNCHIVFKSEYIEKRASLFEENPIRFLNRHGHIAGRPIPKGYRATWKNRGILAVAKLHGKVELTTTNADFQNLLISGTEEETDFIEVHIYGAIHAKTFERISIFGKLSTVERALLNAHREKIKALGINLIESTD